MAIDRPTLEALKRIVGEGGWSEDPERLAPKLVEWRGRWRGRTPLLLAPADVEAVARIVRFCAEQGVPLVVQGGNTGLVGGQTPQGEVLLSLERLNRVRSLHLEDAVLVAEAGATLRAVREAAEAAGRLFPLSLASEGSCTIGGLVSTNAGGTAVLRYGTMRALVTGLEAVLPDGRIHRGLTRLRKDATGPDIDQLLIGAEGTLGVVTAASLRLFPRLRDRATALAALPDPEAAVALLSRIQEASGGAVEAFELINRLGVDLAVRHLPNVRDPLPGAPYVALVEVAYAQGERAGEVLEGALQAAAGDLVLDAVLARSAAQASALWALREGQSAAQKGEGAVWKHDVSTPVSRIAEFVRAAEAAVRELSPDVRVVAFGHVGDGNIHFDVLKPAGTEDAAHEALREAAARRVHDVACALEGSISAEHGLGVMKSEEARRRKDPVEVRTLEALRRVLDPGRILNPRVLF